MCTCKWDVFAWKPTYFSEWILNNLKKSLLRCPLSNFTFCLKNWWAIRAIIKKSISAIIKKFQTSERVANLPGKGRNGWWGRTTVQELQTLDAYQSLKMNHRTLIPTGSLEGLHEESPSWEQPTNSSVWSFPNVIGTMTGTGCNGQMRPKWNFLAMYNVSMLMRFPA